MHILLIRESGKIFESQKCGNNAQFTLKDMSDIFLLFCFLTKLKESTFETRKNVFCFTAKLLFILEIHLNFRILGS